LKVEAWAIKTKWRVLSMRKIRNLYKKAFTPVSMMVIPHSNIRPLNFKVPLAGIFISVVLWVFGTIYILSAVINSFEYRSMGEKLNYYSQQFIEMQTTMSALKSSEREFKRLLSLKTKEKILENIDTADSGSIEKIDIESLRQQIQETIGTVSEIKDYLRHQRNLYFAIPKGLPVEGRISSGYGKRKHPLTGENDFHTGMDISASYGAPVRATSDGIVSFSGLGKGSGRVVVLEHGLGFSTLYAHNSKTIVKVGQKVKRDEIIGYVGATGNATGPHVHYEVWKTGRSVNPKKYIGGMS
jgi:murein DD-endopeptidase MepM/ murein hydrolase activator NlpD